MSHSRDAGRKDHIWFFKSSSISTCRARLGLDFSEVPDGTVSRQAVDAALKFQRRGTDTLWLGAVCKYLATGCGDGSSNPHEEPAAKRNKRAGGLHPLSGVLHQRDGHSTILGSHVEVSHKTGRSLVTPQLVSPPVVRDQESETGSVCYATALRGMAHGRKFVNVSLGARLSDLPLTCPVHVRGFGQQVHPVAAIFLALAPREVPSGSAAEVQSVWRL